MKMLYIYYILFKKHNEGSGYFYTKITSILLRIFQEPAVDLCSQVRGGGRCLQLTCSKFSHWLKVD